MITMRHNPLARQREIQAQFLEVGAVISLPIDCAENGRVYNDRVQVRVVEINRVIPGRVWVTYRTRNGVVTMLPVDETERFFFHYQD